MSLKSLDKLLDGGEVKVVPVGTKKKGLMASSIVAIALGIGATGLYVHNHHDNSISTSDKGILSSLKEKIQNSPVSVINRNPIYIDLPTPELQKKVDQAGNFSIPLELKPNQISRYVSQMEFKDKNYLLSLISEAEGFRPHLYNDNVGFAFGNGWNLSMQNKTYNSVMASAISKDKEYIKNLTSLSGITSEEKIPPNFKNLSITPQRAIQVAQLMSFDFEKSVISGIEKELPKNETARHLQKSGKSYATMSHEIFDGLKENQKAALIYHAYKVGGGGFNKYTGLIDNLIDYSLSNQKTAEKEKTIAEHFTYKYKMNGEMKEDLRASILISSMFLDENAFGYIIGKNVAPKNIKESIPAFGKYNVNIVPNADNLKLPDPVGEKRSELEKSGQQVKIQIVPEDSVWLQQQKTNNKKKGPEGYFW